MMSIKRIILFVTAFIVSCVIVIVFNSLDSDYVESEEYLVGEYKINMNETLHIILNNEIDKKDERYISPRIVYLDSEDLTDTIKIYRIAFYAYDKKEPEISADGNNIIFEDFIGPVVNYISSTFIIDSQFDNIYFQNKTRHVYRVEVPQGTNIGVLN